MAGNSIKKAYLRKSKRTSLTRQKYLEARRLLRDSIMVMLKAKVAVPEIMKATKASRALVYMVKRELAANPPVETVTVKELPWYALKASDPWSPNALKDQQLFKQNCVGCRQEMWTDRKQNDLCETCMYQAMTDAAEASIVREAPRFVNPFSDGSDTRERAALRDKL